MSALQVLYLDDWFVAVDKPAGMVVHRNPYPNQGRPVLQALRDQLGQRLYPVHRLDRPTSGALIFGRSPEAASRLNAEFTARRVEKRYLAVVRGHTPASERIDYALREEHDSAPQPAVTHYCRLATAELDVPCGRYPTARYSLLEVRPETGRYRQIRKHMHHISHPIIGDTSHGDGRHNRLFRTHFASHRLLLFATELHFTHPFQGGAVTVTAPPDAESLQLFQELGFEWPRRPADPGSRLRAHCK